MPCTSKFPSPADADYWLAVTAVV